MLSSPAPFPQVGSTGYLRGTLQPARIVRRNADGSLLLALLERRPGGTLDTCRNASGNVTMPAGDLYETEDEARWPNGKPRGRSRPSKRTRARQTEKA